MGKVLSLQTKLLINQNWVGGGAIVGGRSTLSFSYILLQRSSSFWWDLMKSAATSLQQQFNLFIDCHHHNSFTWCWKDPLTLPSYQDEVHPATRAWIPKVGTINLHKADQVDLADRWHLAPDLRYVARLAWDITNTPSWSTIYSFNFRTTRFRTFSLTSRIP